MTGPAAEGMSPVVKTTSPWWYARLRAIEPPSGRWSTGTRSRCVAWPGRCSTTFTTPMGRMTRRLKPNNRSFASRASRALVQDDKPRGRLEKKERGHRVVSLFCFPERGRHAGRDERRAASADAPDDAASVRGAPRTHHRRNGLERRGPVGYRRGVGPLQRRPEGHPEGGDIEIKGRWQGNDFVVERKVSGGRKVTEDYLRSQDGKQLYVIVKFEGGRGRSIEFRRVYDGAAAM